MTDSRPRSGRRPSPTPGQLLKRTVLGSGAVYRVVGANARGVEVEVVDAPGLKPGNRFTFTAEDVEAMETLDAPDSPAAREPVRGVKRRRLA